jgi:hypothetical protein
MFSGIRTENTHPLGFFFFQSRTSLFKVTNPRAYCVCRRNLTAGQNLVVVPKRSLCSYHTVTIYNTHSQQPHAPDRFTAPLQLNVRYYSTVWGFPPTYCTSTGLPTSTANFPVSLRHSVQLQACSSMLHLTYLFYTV